MEQKLERLRFLLGQAADLAASQALLDWDQQTYMPVGGAEDRSDQISTLARLLHETVTSPEVGALLEGLKPWAESLHPDSNDARLIRVARRNYDKLTHVPARWVAESAQASSLGHAAWEHARANNDFKHFEPFLQRIINLRQEYAGFFAPYDHIYDPLLDDFEPGLKTREVQQIFSTLRSEQVKLIAAIGEKPQVDDSFLSQEYPDQAQWDFGIQVISQLGLDWQHARQDRSAHPFTTDFGIGDMRITTRIDAQRFDSAFFSSVHECGHALYQQGIHSALCRTPLAAGASMAVHESQSRLWENLVGRSLDFWTHFYPLLQQRFPAQLANVNLTAFYKGINRVEPSFIRVESDEATYNLHIMLRLELEIALMEGSLSVQDLPQAWNARMHEYLGITPPTASLGVLQDVHWSASLIGYFPTYALGNLISVQLWECAEKDIPDLGDRIRQGDFAPLREWLRRRIHQHGAKFEPQELVEKVTGSRIDPHPYLKYLRNKYGAIYGL